MSMTTIPMYRTIFDVPMLGTGYEAASFAAHRAFVLGVWGGSMSKAQRAMFAEMTGGRAQLKRPPRTLVIVKSRRVAGTRIAVSISQALALADWPRAPGEKPVVKYFGVDRAQTGVAFGYARGSFDSSRLLRHEVINVTQQRIELKNGNALEIATADDAALRGFTPIAYVVDEACYVAGLEPMLAAMRPGLVTLPGSMMILVSTPAGATGPVYELDKRYYGVDDPDTLVVHAHVAQWNPTISASFVQKELELDPYRAPAEWLCVFISGLASFVDVPLVDGNTRPEPREVPYHATTATGTPIRYHAAIDASGGRGDAAAAAVAHNENGRVIVDACRRYPSPHDPSIVAGQIAAFLKGYGLTRAESDKYAAGFATSAYGAAGITLANAPGTRSDGYLHLLPLLTQGKIELPPDPVLRQELLGLERRTHASGRDSVDHRPNAHDDLANATALAAWAASRLQVGQMQDVLLVPSQLHTNPDSPYFNLRDALDAQEAGQLVTPQRHWMDNV